MPFVGVVVIFILVRRGGRALISAARGNSRQNLDQPMTDLSSGRRSVDVTFLIIRVCVGRRVLLLLRHFDFPYRSRGHFRRWWWRTALLTRSFIPLLFLHASLFYVATKYPGLIPMFHVSTANKNPVVGPVDLRFAASPTGLWPEPVVGPVNLIFVPSSTKLRPDQKILPPKRPWPTLRPPNPTQTIKRVYGMAVGIRSHQVRQKSLRQKSLFSCNYHIDRCLEHTQCITLSTMLANYQHNKHCLLIYLMMYEPQSKPSRSSGCSRSRPGRYAEFERRCESLRQKS